MLAFFPIVRVSRGTATRDIKAAGVATIRLALRTRSLVLLGELARALMDGMGLKIPPIPNRIKFPVGFFLLCRAADIVDFHATFGFKTNFFLPLVSHPQRR